MKSALKNILNLQNIYDIEQLVNGDDFKLTFNKTYFDETQGKTLPGDLETIDNNKLFLDILMSQEFSQLKKFFEVIEAREVTLDKNSGAVIFSETLDEYNDRIIKVKRAKVAILKIFNQIAYYKGTTEYILFFLRFFVELKGREFHDKAEVNTFDNCSYSVTANCSIEEWEEIIKPIVHPVGFRCVFLNINGQNFSTLTQRKTFSISELRTKLDVGFQNLNLEHYNNLNFDELISERNDNFTDGFISSDTELTSF